jgi:hypothetical protein
MSSGGGGGNNTTNIISDPWAPSTGALNQIISEAGTVYGQGPAYAAPSQTTLTGLAAQEQLAGAANKQLAATVAGQYSNPFLSPIISGAANEVYSNVASQFSGAGRTPGGTVSQQQVATGIAEKALPYAFQSYEGERGRQLQTAQQLPSLTSVGQTMDDMEKARLNAPYENLINYANIMNPIARGGQTQQTVGPAPNRLGMAAGGALMGSQLGNMVGGTTGGTYGAILGALGGLL